MAKFEEAMEELQQIWVCMKCNATIKAPLGKRPYKCRKCGSKKLRKKKLKKGQ